MVNTAREGAYGVRPKTGRCAHTKYRNDTPLNPKRPSDAYT
jgi:hypothetical protein